jgi:hypothetical protein
MKLSQVKVLLPTLEKVSFVTENGIAVPEHFHVTEVGFVQKHFIDCGGTVREEKKVNFQLWTANDYEHRLSAAKLLQIIQLSEEKLGIEDAEVEVEYQDETIGKYALAFDGENFILKSTQTDCLAKGKCGIPQAKPKVKLSDLTTGSCTPGGGCC